MAETNQPAAAAGRGGGNAPRGRGRGGNAAAMTGGPILLNPERAPALISKWQKLLGKDLEEIRVRYTADFVSVELFGMEGTPYYKENEDSVPQSISVPEYRNIKARESAPSNEDAKYAFRNKFEVRLNLPFPGDIDLGDGSEAAIRRAVQALPFEQRRVMLLSNKQFKSAYPNGVAGAVGPAT